MPQTTPPTNPNFIAAAWRHLPTHLRLRLYLITWLSLNPPPRIILIPILHTILTFILILNLPIQPKSILIALSLSLCISISVYSLLTHLPRSKGSPPCPHSVNSS